MNKSWLLSARRTLAGALLCVLTPTYALTAAPVEIASSTFTPEFLGKLPLAFETNQGQVNSTVKFISRGPGYKLFLTEQEAVMVFDKNAKKKPVSNSDYLSSHLQTSDEHVSAVVRMRFEGANQTPSMKAEDSLDFKTNYFNGADGATNFTDVPNHRRIKYTSIYPGVDLLYYGNQQQLEYDLLIAPKANPQQIKLRFFGAEKVTLSKQGDLILTTTAGEVTYHKPVAYQTIGGKRNAVDANYQLAENGQVNFRLGKYDTRHTLVIDPVLNYATYIWDYVSRIAVDASGNVYLAGTTVRTDLPASSGYQTKLAGTTDAFVIKVDPTGTKIVYATYLGVRRSETHGDALAIDTSGNAYLAGSTYATAFPVTSGAYQTNYSADPLIGRAAFVTKINPSGNGLVYSTFVGGAWIGAVALDANGNLYMTGSAASLKTTAGAFQSTNPSTTTSPFVAKLNATGSTMSYATYLGGSGTDISKSITVDTNGNAYVVGTTASPNFPITNSYQPGLQGVQDAFVTKMNTTGTGLVYSTYLGGSRNEDGNDIAVNALGEAFVVGSTGSDDFPVTQGVFQPRKGFAGYGISNAFISKISATGEALIFSSYLGGDWYFCTNNLNSCMISLMVDHDAATAVRVDAAGYAYVAGKTTTIGFPLVDQMQERVSSDSDFTSSLPFVVKIRPQGDGLTYSVLLGVPGELAANGLALDQSGNVYTVGRGGSSPASPILNFPVTTGAFLTSGHSFLYKLSAGKYTTLVRSSNNPSSSGESIKLTADVQNINQSGTVTFMDGTITLGTVAVTNGAATLMANLPAGVHKITAIYSVDGQVSLPFFQVVNSK